MQPAGDGFEEIRNLPSIGWLPTFGSGALEDLLDMNFYLPQERGGDCVAVAFVGQDGHALPDAVRLEDCFRDPVGQAVERADDDDAIVAF